MLLVFLDEGDGDFAAAAMATVGAAHDFVVKGQPGLEGMGGRADADDRLGGGCRLHGLEGLVLQLPALAEDDEDVAVFQVGEILLLLDTRGDRAGVASFSRSFAHLDRETADLYSPEPLSMWILRGFAKVSAPVAKTSSKKNLNCRLIISWEYPLNMVSQVMLNPFKLT